MSVSSGLGLSETIQFNPELSAGFKSLFTRATTFNFTNSDSRHFSYWGAALIILIAIGLAIFYFIMQSKLGTPSNVAKKNKDFVRSQGQLSLSNPSRMGLRKYLQQLSQSGVAANQIAFSNFYVSTVNAAGVFLPANDGIVSADAAQLAALGGARAFVIDVWPDLSGQTFNPIVQVVDVGSTWRQITMNSQPLSVILRAIITEAFEIPERPGFEDPLLLYFRWRGVPRAETFNAAAAMIRATMEQYRLDESFNACRAQNRIPTMPITSFFRRVIIFSNNRGEGTQFIDYVNICPTEGVKIEYSPTDIAALTPEMRTSTAASIRQNITWIVPNPETSVAATNSWNVGGAQAVGAQCCAVNFWETGSQFSEYKKMFTPTSFVIKPPPLRYSITTLPDPLVPVNPGMGTGASAGTLPSYTIVAPPATATTTAI